MNYTKVTFLDRHIGLQKGDIETMLDSIGLDSLDQLVSIYVYCCKVIFN